MEREIIQIDPLGEILINYFMEGCLAFLFDVSFIDNKKALELFKYLLNKIGDERKIEPHFLNYFKTEKCLFVYSKNYNNSPSGLYPTFNKKYKMYSNAYDFSNQLGGYNPMHIGVCSYMSFKDLLKHVNLVNG